METMYEIHFGSGKIEKVRVTKTSDKSVWVERGFKHVRAERWVTEYSGIYPTLQAAQNAAKHKLAKDIEALQTRIDRLRTAESRVANIEEQYIPEPPVFQKLVITSAMIHGDGVKK
jgi:hypothetical protein